MKEKKPRWKKPQLIVIGRGTPEERVLAACKALHTLPPGPLANNHCHQAPESCSAVVSS